MGWIKGMKMKKGALTAMAKRKKMSLSEYCSQPKKKLSSVAKRR